MIKLCFILSIFKTEKSNGYSRFSSEMNLYAYVPSSLKGLTLTIYCIFDAFLRINLTAFCYLYQEEVAVVYKL